MGVRSERGECRWEGNRMGYRMGFLCHGAMRGSEAAKPVELEEGLGIEALGRLGIVIF